jgi:hypothetical protein
MSEVKAGRGASFSMLFVMELVAQAAFGSAAVARAMARDGRYILDGPASYHLGEFWISSFLGTLGAIQGFSVLVERARGRGWPWGYGRWVLVAMALLVPVRVLMWFKFNGYGLHLIVERWERDPWWVLERTLPVGISDRDALCMIAVFVALRLGRSREEREWAVVDAREWVGRGLAAVVAACLIGVVAINFVMY